MIYVLDPDRRLIYANPAWDRFAAENGAPWQLKEIFATQSIMACVPEVLRDFYKALYQSVAATGKPVGHTYECSSAEKFRLFHMLLMPLKHRAGIVSFNSLIAEEPHKRASVEAQLERYLTPDALIIMCAHCRRMKQGRGPAWDWVPDLVERPPDNVSHGLCPICLKYHLARRRRLSLDPI